MKLSLVISTILISLFSYSTTVGQEIQEEGQDTTSYYGKVIITEIGLDVVQPLRTYADRTLTGGIGFALKALIQRREGGTVFLGGSFYYHGFESSNVLYTDFFNNVAINVRDKVSTQDMGLDFVMRKYPGLVLGRFELYVEGSLGMKWIYTTLTSTDTDSNQNLNFDFLQNDIAFTYGANLGMQVYLTDNYFLNFSTGYFGSTSVTYYGRQEGLGGVEAIDAFRLNTSLTDLLRYQLGVTWTF